MGERELSDLDSDLRLRLSQAMLNQSLRPVVDAEKETLIECGPGVEEGELERTAVIGEEEQRAAHELDLARGGVGLPRRMSGAQEWLLLPLSGAPEGVIGFGGEGIVYSYVQRELGREVAVKTLRADRWSYEAIESLLREACVTARLEHPNIVPVYYLHLPEHDGDSPYWAMKWVRGKPLTEHLPSGKDPWPIDKLLEVFRRVLDAVAFAHSKGIVHRDLKPDNVLVGEFGEVQVTDWGLAVAINEEGARGATPLLQDGEAGAEDAPQQREAANAGGEQGYALSGDLARLNTDVRSGRVGALLNTSAGGRSGTPAYMAPEQLEITAGNIAERTDVFLLGGILYAVLTGQPPHQLADGDDTDAARWRLEQIRSCSAIRSVIDVRREHGLSGTPEGMSEAALASLWDITRKALSPEPGDRFGSVPALEAALDEWESRSSSQELHAQASVRLAELESQRRPSARGYAEVIALADASLEKWDANDEALRVRDEASSALATIQRRSSQRFWTAAAAIVLVFLVGAIGYQRTRFQRNRAESQRQIAIKRQQEAEAAREKEETERKRAEREMYCANIGLADQRIRDAQIGDAERLLGACPEQLRCWEWRRLKRLCHLALLTLRGHSEGVSAVAFSPDGRQIASASPDRTVRLWDTETGSVSTVLEGHITGVNCVAFSPGGERIASGSSDGIVNIWSTTTGLLLQSIAGHNGSMHTIAFSPDGRRFACGLGRHSRDGRKTSGEWRMWDRGSWDVPALARSLSYPVLSVAFSPDGGRIALGTYARNVWICDAQTGEGVLTLKGRSSVVRCVAYSPDGSRVASGGNDRAVEVWDARNGRHAMTLNGHKAVVRSVTFSPDGERIASGSWDNTVKLWDARTGSVLMTLGGHTDQVLSVAFSPDGRRIASGSCDRTVKVWDAETKCEAVRLTGYAAAMSPDGERVVTANADATVRVWDVATGREAMRLPWHYGYASSVAFSPDSKWIATGGYDRAVRIWDAETGRELKTLKGHSGYVWSVAFSPSPRRLASGSMDKTVRVWDTEASRDLMTLKGHDHYVSSVAFSPDGRWVASGSYDQTAKVWDAASGREAVTLRGHNSIVESVAFGPNSEHLATASRDRTGKVWDVVTGREIATLRGHSDLVLGIAFTPVGKRIASGCHSGSIKLWDTETYREVLTLEGHDDEVKCVAFSPDGEQLISASRDKTVRIWDSRPVLRASRYLADADNGQAGALYHLAVIRERNHNDGEARELHQRAAAATEAAQKEWAEKSRWRLEHMPWLRTADDADGRR